MKSSNKVFLETLVISLALLIIGFSIGYYVENARVSSVEAKYQEYEIQALDLKLQNYYYQIMDKASCNEAISQNFIFADKIYDTGLQIEKYEEASQITSTILLEKKKYVLLKTELWLNSILLKQKCNKPFHTLVYIYYQTTDQAKRAEQDAISNTLMSIKQELGNKVVLLPIAGDMGIDTVTMQMAVYNISYLPSVIIDEATVLQGYKDKAEIEKYLN